MTIVNYEKTGTAFVTFSTLNITNITKLPNDYIYKFDAVLSMFQTGEILNNTNLGKLNCDKPLLIKIYKDGVYMGSSTDLTPTSYSGFVQDTKYVIFDNTTTYPDPQKYLVDIFMGGFTYEYTPTSIGEYTFNAFVDYEFYCDDAYNGYTFNVTISTWGLKSNSLVPVYQLTNATLQSGSNPEAGYVNANCWLDFTPLEPVSSYIFIGPCLYQKTPNVWNPQLLFQPYINVSTNDPIQYGCFPYKFRVVKWVFMFDDTSYTPAYVKINIQMKQKSTPSVLSAQGQSILQNFAFQNNSIIIEANLVSVDVQLNVPVQFYCTFYNSTGGTQNFSSEFIVHPYVYQLLN